MSNFESTRVTQEEIYKMEGAVCSNYSNGYCSRGENCKYAHPLAWLGATKSPLYCLFFLMVGLFFLILTDCISMITFAILSILLLICCYQNLNWCLFFVYLFIYFYALLTTTETISGFSMPSEE